MKILYYLFLCLFLTSCQYLVCVIPALYIHNEDDLKVVGGNSPGQIRLDGAYFTIQYDSLGRLKEIDYKILYADFTSCSGGVVLRLARNTYPQYYTKEHNAFEKALTIEDTVNVFIEKIIPESFYSRNEAVMHWWGSWNVVADTLEIKFIQPKRQCMCDALHVRYLVKNDTTLIGVDSFYSEKKYPCRESSHSVYQFRSDFPKPDSTNNQWKYWKSKK